MRGGTVGRVVASKSDKFKTGDLATAFAGWTEVAVLQDKELTKLNLPSGTRTSDALGVLGMTMFTAYFGVCGPTGMRFGSAITDLRYSYSKSVSQRKVIYWSYQEQLEPQDRWSFRSVSSRDVESLLLQEQMINVNG